MGKKSHGKYSAKGAGNLVSSNNPATVQQPKVLSRQKRNDLNQLVDRLLKGRPYVEIVLSRMQPSYSLIRVSLVIVEPALITGQTS